MKKSILIIILLITYNIFACTIEVTNFQVIKSRYTEEIDELVVFDYIHGVSRFLKNYKSGKIKISFIDNFNVNESIIEKYCKKTDNIDYIKSSKLFNYLKKEGYPKKFITNPIILEELNKKFSVEFIINVKLNEKSNFTNRYKDKKIKDLFKIENTQKISTLLRLVNAINGSIVAIDTIYGNYKFSKMYSLDKNKKEEIIESFETYTNLPDKYSKFQSKHPDKGIKYLK